MRTPEPVPRALGILCLGIVCSLITCRDAGASGAAPPPAPDVYREPAAVACAPAPTSTLVVNVKAAPFLAAGDGVADDSAALQRAIDKVGGTGGTVLVPDGTYLVNAIRDSGRVGLRLRSRMTLRLSKGAVLKAIPNALGSYSILTLAQVQDVNVVGGTLEGERRAHLGTGGEWGMGLAVIHSKNIAIQGVTARECWGDGFYVAEASSNVTLCNVVADHNRRQGLSIIGGDAITVRSSTFRNTEGTEPESGIDVEPDPGESVTNLLITDCSLIGNSGGGITLGPAVAKRSRAFFRQGRIQGNRIAGCRRWGIEISACDTNAIEDNTISDIEGFGILVRTYAQDIVVRGNRVTGATRDGIYLDQCPGTTVTGNAISRCGGRSINAISGSGATVQGNTTN